ncbi:MAG TPA: hypothetical protein VKU87_01490, partial [Thermomicrobiaceae bacterium]|nr:hypothetical protein [Thermomicrobiaceae bacterium]
TRRQVEAFRRSQSELPDSVEYEAPPSISDFEQRLAALDRLRDTAGELAILDARIEEAKQSRSRLEAARSQLETATAAEAGKGLWRTLRRLLGLLPATLPDASIEQAIGEQQERIDGDLARYTTRREQLIAASTTSRDAARFNGPLEQALIEREIRRLGQLREEAENRERSRHELAVLSQSLADGQAALDRAAEQLAGAQQRWTDWKSANAFHRTLAPDGVIETIELAHQAAEAQRQVRQLSRERERLSQLTGAYQARALDVLRRLGEPGQDDLSAAMESLRSRLARDQENIRRRLLVEQRLTELQQLRGQAERRVEELETQRGRLFRAAGVEDEAGFRRAIELRAMRNERRLALRECDARIEVRLGTEPEADWLRRQLGLGDIEGWQCEREAALGRVTEVIQQRDALVAERHDLDSACRRLETSTALPDLNQQLSGLQQAFREALADWWRLSLAERLIVETQARFERERQPAVLATASHHFATLTAGAYHRLRQQGHQIVVIDRHGRVRSQEALSRGTIEQLYLCMRLGLVADFAERVVALPLIMDDVLVNVDPQRAKLVAEVLARVAQRHQILLFTCHPETAGVLRSVVPDCGLYAMSRYGGGIQEVSPGPVPPGHFT